MYSETTSVKAQFQHRRQYKIPFYQRSYVWTRDSQWEPLWADIVEKANIRIFGAIPTAHFLGAIVLEPQKRQGLKGVETFHVIDGQQRLTTLQYVLAAILLAMRTNAADASAPVVRECVWNPNTDTMRDPESEIYKVWPTFRDRSSYITAMNANKLDDLRQSFPENFTQTGTLRKIGVRHPPPLDALWFFNTKIEEWLRNTDGNRADCLEELALAVLDDLKIVWITLDEHDDAQVIFETLNGRGAQLDATDLIRNFIFLRADREGSNANALYEKYWKPFEIRFWEENQRRGRLNKPRLEWFVQTALQAEKTDEVEIGRLYSEYRNFVKDSMEDAIAESQLEILNRYADKYRRLVEEDDAYPIGEFGMRVGVWDASASHPLALKIGDSGLPANDRTQMFNDIVSYLVRRAVCGLTAKNYNKVFLQILRRMVSEESCTPEGLRTALMSMKGEGSRWPTDDEFRHAWLTGPALRNVGGPRRIKRMLIEIENGLRKSLSEEVLFKGGGELDVDHIMPTNWYKHWPLNGENISFQEARDAKDRAMVTSHFSERTEAILRRERLKETFGNLTLANISINRASGHKDFSIKRQDFFDNSTLHLNRMLMKLDEWDERQIEKRGQALFDVARRVWPHPTG
jgi:hypothetical protein